MNRNISILTTYLDRHSYCHDSALYVWLMHMGVGAPIWIDVPKSITSSAAAAHTRLRTKERNKCLTDMTRLLNVSVAVLASHISSFKSVRASSQLLW